MLRGARCLEAHEGADAQSKIQALEVAVKELESKLKEEQSLNEELQRALCEKIFAQAPAPATPERNTVAAKPPPLVPSSAPSGSGASARHTDASVVRGQQGTFRPCKGVFCSVHLGHGSYIEEDMREGLISLPTDFAFCKQLAVRLWGNETLKERSLTGTLSNQAIAKGTVKKQTPLTPKKVASLSDAFWRYLTLRGVAEADLPKRHKLLTRYLAQKCADLRR